MTVRRLTDPTLAGDSARIFTIAAANTLYQRAVVLQPGVYVVTVNTGTLNMAFYSSTGTILGSGGVGTYTLNELCTQLTFFSTAASSVTLTFSRSFSTTALTGTATEYTTTGNITISNRAVVTCLGGGGAGGAKGTFNAQGSSGGGSGYISTTPRWVTAGTYAIVIGAGGASAGASGGTTTFDTNLTAAGGAGGAQANRLATLNVSNKLIGGAGGSGGGGGVGSTAGGSGGNGGSDGSAGGTGTNSTGIYDQTPANDVPGGAGSGRTITEWTTPGAGGSPNGTGGGGRYAGGAGGNLNSGSGAANGRGGGGQGSGWNAGTGGGAGAAGAVYVLEFS